MSWMLGAICLNLEGKIQEGKKFNKTIFWLSWTYWNKDTKYLDEKPKNAVNWNKKSIQDIEKDYGDLINPK